VDDARGIADFRNGESQRGREMERSTLLDIPVSGPRFLVHHE
jgi:hypothetical protein